MSTNSSQESNADGLSEIAHALGIQPSMTKSREALSTLVENLTKYELFGEYFLPFLAGYSEDEADHYDWNAHNEDPAKILAGVAAFWNALGPRRNMTRQGFSTHSIGTFSEMQVWFRRAIATEILRLLPHYDCAFLWHPRSLAHGDAFGYVLFLWMYMQTGAAPDAVSRIYANALRYLSTEFRCLACSTDFKDRDDKVCYVCPTLQDGNVLESPWL
ncbi:hypothetical protein GGR50DRAFT_230395 [Xylaria sp. CBS 124048]|nr:hypothetical protein GGR50DRAFT_230395 [Xylaria sp. CBS 124048]